MKIAVFGGTGRVGQKIVQLALINGIEVKALVRNRQKAYDSIKGAEIVEGEATKREDIIKTLRGCDAVFSGLSTDKTDTLSKAIPIIAKEMEAENIRRIVTIGTAGILDSRVEEGKFRYQSSESKRKTTFAAEEHAKVYQTFLKSDLDWTIICPTYLPDGYEHGSIRFECDYLPDGGKKITVGDTARFAYEELLENRFICSRVGICY